MSFTILPFILIPCPQSKVYFPDNNVGKEKEPFYFFFIENI